jgi:hypothetical protein
MPLFKRLGMGTRLSAISLHFSYGIEYMSLMNIYSYSKEMILREIFIILFILIPVVINMFRLPDFLTGDNITSNGLKLLQT